MKASGKIRILLLMLLGSLGCRAQLVRDTLENDRWQLNGSAGFSYGNQLSTQSSAQSNTEFGIADFAGDIRLNLAGFIKDPRLLTFTANVGELQTAVGGDTVGSSGDRLSLGFNSTFLRQRPWPLSISYYRNSGGTETTGLSQKDSDSELRINWKLLLRNKPRLNVYYTRAHYANSVTSSLLQADSKHRNFHVDAEDNALGWHWSSAFDINKDKFTSLGGLTFQIPQSTNTTTLISHAERTLFHDKVSVGLAQNLSWLSSEGSISGYGSRTAGFSASAAVRHTSKLTSIYSYSFSHASVDQPVQTGTINGQPVVLLFVPNSETQDVSGRLLYDPLPAIHLNGRVQYTTTTPIPSSFEVPEKFLTPGVGINASKHVHGFDVGAGYNLDFQHVTGDRGSESSAVAHSANVSAGWGDASRVRLTGMFGLSNRSILHIIGGYGSDRHVSMQAETAALAPFRITGRVQYTTSDVLAQGGHIQGDGFTESINVSHRRFALGVGHSNGAGDGALFANPIVSNEFIFALPVSQLLGSPLLNRESSGTTVNLSLYLLRNLDLTAYWIKEHDTLPTFQMDFTTFDVHAKYRLGRFTFEGGYLRNSNVNVTGATPGLAAALNNIHNRRIFIRIARDFTIF